MNYSIRTLLPGLAAVTATALVLGAGLPASAAPAAMTDASHPAHLSAAPSVETRITFRNAMGKYWEDHITWTRLFIIADLADSPDLPMTTQRLLQNQVDIGNAFKPYYGKAAGNQLTALLKEHILIAGKIIESGKKAPLPSVPAIGDWYKNADQIAAAFSRMNPQAWPYGEMRNMMHHHLKITTSEVLSVLHGGTGADAYNGVHRQAMQMADMLTAGIQKQFGGKRVAVR